MEISVAATDLDAVQKISQILQLCCLTQCLHSEIGVFLLVLLPIHQNNYMLTFLFAILIRAII